MDGEGIVWLIAVGWVILSWIMKAIRGAAGQGGKPTEVPGPVDDQPDAHDLRERRARLRMERARRRLNKTPSPREDALQDLRRELERVMGVHVEEEHGPTGRRSTVALESDEEVEERESLEEEPEVISMETAGDRGVRVVVDQDSQAEELVQRRIAVAEAHSRPLSRADHKRFDARIREPVSVQAAPAAPRKPPHSLRQAFIWSEVLGKPVSDRER
jgi:hypothetical protein